MKKIAIAIIIVFFIGLSLSSCRSTKPPCPAYTTVQVENNVQNYTR